MYVIREVLHCKPGKVRPMLEAAAKDYVSKDPAWPKRSEPCDKSS